MIAELFKQYLKVKKNVSDRSVGHYITGINTINSLLVKYNSAVEDIFAIEDVSALETVEAFLKTNPEFLEKDAIGHKMYSSAFRHFCNFAHGDRAFFSTGMLAMDIAVRKPATGVSGVKRWRRNPIVVFQAIESAGYACEFDGTHETFIAQSTGKAYMEGHHLIPMKHQSLFEYSLDVYANIVCLCPVCHRLLHFGKPTDKQRVAEALFDRRQIRLQRSGICLTKDEFLELVIDNENGRTDQL